MSATDNLTITSSPEALFLQLLGVLDQRTTPGVLQQIDRLPRPLPKNIVVDLQGVEGMDDCGALIIMRLQHMEETRNCHVRLENVPDAVRELLRFLNLDIPTRTEPYHRKRENIISRFGQKTLYVLQQIRANILFVGDVTVTMLSLLRHPGQLRLGDMVVYMQRVGVDALPIVGLISFLLGLIMAFMSAVQLQQFGANIYVASLVALSMVRELGPIMTAIIVAGRSGSAFAAEIGTMQVSEEVDALTTMGFKPTMFLVLPKVLASMLVVPFLAVFSNLFAIAGGLLIGVTTLSLTPHAYMLQTMSTLTIFDIAWGIFKSALFAIIIATIGCFKGSQVRGGAASVGQATTSAVVSGIFMVILIDSILAVILRYWRP